jgi:hypothetical protein
MCSVARHWQIGKGDMAELTGTVQGGISPWCAADAREDQGEKVGPIVWTIIPENHAQVAAFPTMSQNRSVYPRTVRRPENSRAVARRYEIVG